MGDKEPAHLATLFRRQHQGGFVQAVALPHQPFYAVPVNRMVKALLGHHDSQLQVCRGVFRDKTVEALYGESEQSIVILHHAFDLEG